MTRRLFVSHTIGLDLHLAPPRHEPDVLTAQGLLAQIVEVSGDAIFSEDLQGNITSWNTAAERLYGCAAKDMLGRPAADLLPDSTAKRLRAVHQLALSGKRVDRFDTLHQ